MQLRTLFDTALSNQLQTCSCTASNRLVTRW